jgi:hypothetical protein
MPVNLDEHDISRWKNRNDIADERKLQFHPHPRALRAVRKPQFVLVKAELAVVVRRAT